MNVGDRVKSIYITRIRLRTAHGVAEYSQPAIGFDSDVETLIIGINHGYWRNSCAISTTHHKTGFSHFRFKKIGNVKPKCKVCGKRPHKDGEVCPKLRFEQYKP